MLFMLVMAFGANFPYCNGHFNLAGQFPMLNTSTTPWSPHYTSLAIQQAMLMALSEINNKTDGIADDLLPNNLLRIALRSARPSFELAVAEQIAAFEGDDEVVACVGPMNYDAIRGTAPVFEARNITQIGYGAREPSFGLSDIYPVNLRTIPGYYVDGKIIADMVHYFQWKRVTVFSSSGTYGNMAAFFFREAAKTLGIEIMSNHKISTENKDYSSSIGLAKEAGAKIFVLLMPGKAAAKLLKQGYEENLFKGDTVIIGGEFASSMSDWKAEHPNLPLIVTGYLGIAYKKHPPYTEEKQGFIDRFRHRKSTLGTAIFDAATNETVMTDLQKRVFGRTAVVTVTVTA
jgi:ABC-type branched-subunit amino acid transport system substrate-binding protein